MNDQIQQLMRDAPAWAREPAVLIGAGIVLALLLLWLLSRLFRARPREEESVEQVVEEYPPVVRPITPPPVTPPPPPLAAEPFAQPLPVVVEEPRAPEPEPEPVVEAFVQEREPLPEPEPAPAPYSPYIPEAAPEPAQLADEPIVAAAPFDASPASIAADVPEPEPAPAEPVYTAPDDLTRMKGVGPRLADRLGSVGITSFAQIAALTPADADALDARLGDFQGRIHRDRWIEQAGYLASGDIDGFEATFGKL